MGGSTVIEGVNDRADMVETRKTFTLLGKWNHPMQRVTIFSLKNNKNENREAQQVCVLKTPNKF